MHITAYVEQIEYRKSEASSEANKLAQSIAMDTRIPEDVRKELMIKVSGIGQQILKITSET